MTFSLNGKRDNISPEQYLCCKEASEFLHINCARMTQIFKIYHDRTQFTIWVSFAHAAHSINTYYYFSENPR